MQEFINTLFHKHKKKLNPNNKTGRFVRNQTCVKEIKHSAQFNLNMVKQTSDRKTLWCQININLEDLNVNYFK
jgi:hypothetical protein